MELKIKRQNGDIYTVLFDDVDEAIIAPYNWHIHFNARKTAFYAARHLRGQRNEDKVIGMHRFILDAPQGLQVDHINGNSLDNRRNNLRVVTAQQNQANRHKTVGMSHYKGVSWRQSKKKWRSYIKVDKTDIHLGYFSTEIEAALAYNAAAKKFFGEYAKLNDVPSFGWPITEVTQ